MQEIELKIYSPGRDFAPDDATLLDLFRNVMAIRIDYPDHQSGARIMVLHADFDQPPPLRIRGDFFIVYDGLPEDDKGEWPFDGIRLAKLDMLLGDSLTSISVEIDGVRTWVGLPTVEFDINRDDYSLMRVTRISIPYLRQGSDGEYRLPYYLMRGYLMRP